MAQKAVNHYVIASEKLNEKFSNIDVVDGRRRAQSFLLEQAFPTQRDEDWQYTKLTNFVQKHFEVLGKTVINPEDIDVFLPPFAVTRLVFVDGWFDEELSDDFSDMPKGMSLESTRDVFEVPGATDRLYAREGLINSEAFGVLNNMLMADGFYLQIPRNMTVETPIFVLYVQTQENHISTLRNHVVLEENSEITLIEKYVSLAGQDNFEACTNVVTEIDIAQSARMRQVITQQQHESAYYFNNQFVFQADKSDYNTFYAGLGCQLSRHQNHLFMNGEHIESNQNSACLARGKQVVDSRTDTQHNQEWGASKQLHKYVLSDSAVGVFNGMIRVDQQAQKTDGQMDNKNLLLSNVAKMNTKPQLEIYADDVKCSHGSATGQINNDQVFYLQARGIPRIQAIEMITQAFLMEPAETINNALIKKWVMEALFSALTSGGYFNEAKAIVEKVSE